MGRLFTIGFTKTSAERFFTRLSDAGVRVLIDTRLHPSGQLAGFAKAGDLAYFLDRLAAIGYEHAPLLAPTPELLAQYRSGALGWEAYADAYRELVIARDVLRIYAPERLDRACLLCSEATAEHCHRGVAAEVFAAASGRRLSVHHL